MARILNLIQRQWRILGRKKNYEQAVLGNSHLKLKYRKC